MTSQADRLVLRAILENSVAKPLPKSARRAVRAGTRISLGNLSATYALPEKQWPAPGLWTALIARADNS